MPEDRFPHLQAVCAERGVSVTAEQHAELPDTNVCVWYYRVNGCLIQTMWTEAEPGYDALFGMLKGCREIDLSKQLDQLLPGMVIEEPKRFERFRRWRSQLLALLSKETYDLLIGAMLADYQLELAKKEQK